MADSSESLEVPSISETLDVLEWAAAEIDRLAVVTSFQSSGLVILHLLRDIRPDLPVLFLNTGFHFSETLEFAERMVSEWDLKLIELRGAHGTTQRQNEEHGPGLYRRDPNLCCHINKVEPLQRALEEYDGWISGIRRDQSETRAGARLIQTRLLPSRRAIAKIHPLANWSKAEVDAYIDHHSIPTNPLLERGFGSIGCWPCTRRLREGEDERGGRWSGSDKAECGIHSFGEDSTREVEGEQ